MSEYAQSGSKSGTSASEVIVPEELVLVVVGAHPKAERFDRSTAYTLADRIDQALLRTSNARPPALKALVVTDVWYLNDPSLRGCPAVSVGGPGVNALSAYLGDKLPSVFVIDDTLMVQMDTEQQDLLACCWGTDSASTRAAANVFVDRYLDGFVEHACRQMQA